MSWLIRMSVVLSIAAAAIGTVAATAAEWPSDAIDRALATEAAVPTDAHQRGQSVVVAPTDAYERAQPVGTTTEPVAVEADTGWNVSWTEVLIGAAIGAALVVAAVLLTNAIRRHPPRGHPPLAHR